MNDTASLVAGNLIYDGLLRFSPTLTLEGALAEQWSTSSDGKILTFVLRENARFQNGEPVTADDVVFSLRRALSPQSEVRKYYDCIEGKSGEGIVAANPRTVEIHLKHPFPPFLSILAGATAKVLPRKLLTKKYFFEHPIGSGPFQFMERTIIPQKQITLASFHAYYRKAPKIEKLILRELPEAEAIHAAAAGEIQDLANWPLSASSPAFQTGKNVTSPVAATWIIGLNTKMAPFTSLSIRRLLRQDLDTDGFRKKFFPEAFPAYGYIPPGLPGHETISHARTETKSRPPKDTVKIVIPKELARADEMRAFLEKNLRSKGWNVLVVTMDWAELMRGYDQKTHQAFLVSMNMDYPDAEFLLRNFESKNPDNFSSLQDTELDKILEEARTLQDRRMRESLYRKAIRIITDESITINLFHPRANYWISDCVVGFEPNILADVYIDYTKVSLKESCSGKLVRR